MGKGNLSGMDIAQVRELARRMDSEAGQISDLVNRVSTQLEGAEWVGRDREVFLEQWRAGHAGKLRRVVDGLHEASRQANEYANRQEWASRA